MNTNFEEQLDLKKEIFKYLSYWKYFVLCGALALFAAYFYIRYTNPVFAIESKIKILDENDKGLKLPSELLGMMARRTSINLENEMETLKSSRLYGPVVAELNLTSAYYGVGQFRNTEYWNPPITVTALLAQDDLFPSFAFSIVETEKGYIIKQNEAKNIIVAGKHAKVTVNNVALLIEPNLQRSAQSVAKELFVRIVPFQTALRSLKLKISVSPVGKESDLLSVKAQDINPVRGVAIVDKVVAVFNQDGINDRRLVNQKTVDFIDARFKNLTFELDSIEGEKRDFKKSRDISFIEADAIVDVNRKANSDQALYRIETQIQLSDLLKEALKDQESTILPANIGLDNMIINGLVNEYNLLVLERLRLVKTAGDQNPVLSVLDTRISTVKNNINESVRTYGKQLKISLSQQQSDYLQATNMVLQIPSNEKILRSIERQQKIKENLYLLLLQKREESAIAFAVAAPSIKIIEYASASGAPVAPKTTIIYLGALFLGLGIPFGVIFIIGLLDNKVKDVNDDGFRRSQIPVVGEIPFFTDFKIFSDKDDRSVQAESFRILSSNAKYSLPIKEAGVGQVIFVTSSIMGEGKTFVAANLSLAFASYDKKVLLVGADMRKPKLHIALAMDKTEVGLSTYLFEKDKQWRDVVVTNNLYNSNLDVLLSGIIPPNPSNIISNGRFESFIEEAKKEYDYIIVDCAPTIYVNDTFLIAPTADLTLYLTRHDYTEKQLLDYAATLKETGKLKNMAFVFNGIKANAGYGYRYNYGYGYGYGADEKGSRRKQLLRSPFGFIRSYFQKKQL